MDPKSKERGSRKASPLNTFMGEGRQQKAPIEQYPELDAHLSELDPPSYSEYPEEEEILYKLPGYKYAHTLTFLDDFTPEAEAKIIKHFDHAQKLGTEAIGHILPPWHFTSNIELQQQGCSWGNYVEDLAAMNQKWVEDLLGFQKCIPGSQADDTDMADVAGAVNAHQRKPQLLPPRTKKVRRDPKDRQNCVRNMGGPNDLLPFNIWDETSDTESDENAEVVAEHFLSKIDLPERLKNTIPGPGIALTTTSSGLIHFPPKDPTMQSVVDEGGDSFMTDTGYSGQDQFPTVLNDSSPPISTRTPPTTDNPSGFGPRKPDDTRFHHGSAGVDPLGAHGRLLRPTLPPKTRRGRLIVSGSFGTFENTPTSRFDERGYRLLPMSAFSPTPALLTSTASSMEKKKREGDESEDNKKAKKNR